MGANARDIEANVTISDRTDAGLASVERKVKRTNDNIKRESDKLNSNLAQGVVRLVEGISPKLASSLTGAFSSAGASGGPLLVVGVAAAAPFLAATLSAAVIGGAGAGGVLGGILLVKDDPRVSAAGKGLAEKLMSSLKADAQVFVDPVLRSIGEIDDAFGDLRPRIQSVFANSSKFVAPLTEGSIRATDGILRGFQALVAKAGPVMDQLGDSVGDIGDATGDMLETIAGGSESAAKALKQVTTDATLLIRTTGYLVRGLTEVYGWMDKIGLTKALLGPLGQVMDLFGKKTEVAADKADKLEGALDLAAKQWDANQEGIEITNQYLADSEKKMRDAEQATRDLTDANANLYDSETNVGKALDDATEARKKNGRTLDANTEKGRANRDALSGVGKALQGQYDNLLRVNGVTPKTVAAGEAMRSQFIKTAQSFGLSKDQAKALADKIIAIPSKKDAKINVTSNAASTSKEAKDAINSVNSKTVTIGVNFAYSQTKLNQINNTLDRLGGGNFDATNSFAFAGAGSGVSRTGGATPANVTSNIESRLYLDTGVLAGVSRQQVRSSSERDAFRRKVGRR